LCRWYSNLAFQLIPSLAKRFPSDRSRRTIRAIPELDNLRWKSGIALRVLDQLTGGVIVTDSDGRVIQMNRAAERILRLADGLIIRNGKLGAMLIPDNERLSAFVAVAAAGEKTRAAIGRMRVGRHSGRLEYTVTVAPLGDDVEIDGRFLTIILVVDPEDPTPSETELADFFGLSPAESRLAAALMAGKSLSDVAIEASVQITTMRTQLSSILRKVGVKRQLDLVRVLSRIPVIAAGISETK
jgi:DNA-binding CsgD family transcriptional regulator